MQDDDVKLPAAAQWALIVERDRGQRDQQTIDTLVAIAIVLDANDIPDPRLRPVVLPPDWP